MILDSCSVFTFIPLKNQMRAETVLQKLLGRLTQHAM